MFNVFRDRLTALLVCVFCWPVFVCAADVDWGTDLYWQGTLATSGTESYTGRLYYTRLDGGGVTITGISFDTTPADGCTITIPEMVGTNAATDSVFVVNRPGHYSGVKIKDANWRNTPLRWQNAPKTFALSLPGSLRVFCPLIKAANYNSNDTWVTTMTVPDSLLTQLIIRDNTNAHPSARLRIDDFAFYDATTREVFSKFASVTFGKNSVRYIGQYAFADCPITSISQLPEGVDTVGNYAFNHLHVVQDLNLPSTLVMLGDMAFGTIGIKITTSYGWFFHNQLVIPKNMKYIGVGAFCGSRKVRMDVVIPEGVETIGGMAFGNTLIRSVVIPSTVKTIFGGAFRNMRLLETATFKSNTVLSSVGNNLFAGCYALRYLDMSAVNCPVLTSLTVSRYSENTPFYDLVPYTVVYLPQSVKSITIPADETSPMENFVKCGTDGKWTCDNFVVYDYDPVYYPEKIRYSPLIAGTGFHFIENSLTEAEKQEVADWKATLPRERGCDYELPHAFTATKAMYLRKIISSTAPGSVLSISLPYSTTEKDANFKAYRLVSEMELANSKNNKGLWFLSLDDPRLSSSALTTEERAGCLTANHPYVLKLLSKPADTTIIMDRPNEEKFRKLFISHNAEVPATSSSYTEVSPADGSSVWSFVGYSKNIINADAAADHLYVLSASTWVPVRTYPSYGYVHSMRAAMRYKGSDANYAKSFPKMLDVSAPLTSETTGIQVIEGSSVRATAIYTLDGRYAGSSLSSLPHGIYIVTGRKVVK